MDDHHLSNITTFWKKTLVLLRLELSPKNRLPIQLEIMLIIQNRCEVTSLSQQNKQKFKSIALIEQTHKQVKVSIY
jgi:hypothetical protein